MNKYQDALDFIIAATNGGDGMVKELNALQELVEKDTPKKYELKSEMVDGVKWTHAICPNCKEVIDEFEYYPYCPNCGQAILWEDE